MEKRMVKKSSIQELKSGIRKTVIKKMKNKKTVGYIS